MHFPRRSLSLILAALVVLSTSVFSFGPKAYADSIDSQIVSPLRQNEPIIQQQSQLVAQKSGQLSDTSQTIQDLLTKKQTLTGQLQSEQKAIDDLNQQLADKKAAAAAEAARVVALQDMFVHITKNAAGSEGNLYSPGNCTWYVKNRRPDLPNNLGNANTWYYMAAADGFSVGSAPKKGAVGTTTAGSLGHVVYVEGVSLDGSTVTISEMNYAGLYSERTRVAPASDFQYIYELD